MKTLLTFLFCLISTQLFAQGPYLPFSQDPELKAPLTALVKSTAVQDAIKEVNSRDQEPTAARNDFRSALSTAIRRARSAGTVTRAEALRLRVAALSPAFQKHAEDLAVIQIAFSGSSAIGSEIVPVVDGKIDRANIQWSEIIEFLQQLVPILLELIKLFGG